MSMVVDAASVDPIQTLAASATGQRLASTGNENSLIAADSHDQGERCGSQLGFAPVSRLWQSKPNSTSVRRR
jgi:hypothetical protein